MKAVTRDEPKVVGVGADNDVNASCFHFRAESPNGNDLHVRLHAFRATKDRESCTNKRGSNR